MKKVIYNSIRTAPLLLLLAAPFYGKAEAAGSLPEQGASLGALTWFVLGVLGFVVLVLGYLIYALAVFKNQIHPSEKCAPLFAGLMQKLTDSVPVEKEEDILTEHVYDDIRELDNNLPPWWKIMFYLTIVFAGAYLYYYHFTGSGKLQIQEYEAQMAEGEKARQEYLKLASNNIDENSVKVLTDAQTLEKGKTVFTQNCAACHGASGEGKVGPNLTDTYWLHGGGVKNVFKTIKYGVPQKGMMAWETQLSPSNIQDVANYIMSLQGSNPPNAKAPEGNKEEVKEIASNEK